MTDKFSNNRRIARNTIFLYIRMFFSLLVSLYTSRVVLDTLGVVDYGVYNTVAGFVTMFAFLNSTLSASIQRFYNFEGARDGLDGYKKVYFTGLPIHLFVMIVSFILLETFGLWYINNVMVIPQDRITSAIFVFHFSVLSLCLLIVSIPYLGAIMASERMDYYALVSIIDTILRLIIVLILPYLPFDKLSLYGILLFLISVFDFIAYYVYSKKHILKFKFKIQIHKNLLKELLSFSGWNIVGTFAFMLKGQALNMLLNVFFGPIINAARAIAYQINNAINSFSVNISVAYKPQIVNSYSQGNLDRVEYLFFSQSKICFALIAILITPVIIDINYILHLWLGENIPSNTAVFSVLVLVDSLICTLNTPCTQVVYSTGNIKGYQIASSIVNLMLFPICWIFLYLGYDAQSTFIFTILFSVLNQIVCLIQMSRVFDLKFKKYISSVLIPCLTFVCICGLPGIILHYLMPESLMRLLCISCVSIIWGVFVSFFLFIEKNERYKIITMIKSKI